MIAALILLAFSLYFFSWWGLLIIPFIPVIVFVVDSIAITLMVFWIVFIDYLRNG